MTITEIIEAAHERVRDFGPGHEIEAWPLGERDWVEFINDIIKRSPDFRSAHLKFAKDEVDLRTPHGVIRVFFYEI